MAQAEDTELRDLVLEALEKNGSLAKIRALLRANIFLAFEDDCENMKQNVNLDNILKIPEGVLALTIVHEFLEFCNLKNTLFVYMSESRQGTEYTYEGRKILVDRLHFLNGNHDSKEPVLVTFVKNILRPHQKKYYGQGDAGNASQLGSLTAKHRKDDQNCTYIVHEDSSMSTSNSTSDISSDEKNKLHLKLPLDNSDTDTSSESIREKMSSEYIPNQHILSQARSNVDRFALDQFSTTYSQQKDSMGMTQHVPLNTNVHHEIKPIINNSSESTSYIDVKSFKPPDQQIITKPAIAVDNTEKTESSPATLQSLKPSSSLPEEIKINTNSTLSATMNSISSLSMKQENGKKGNKSNLQATDEPAKSDNEVTEYSLDFSLSSVSRNKSIPESQLLLPDQPGNLSLKENSPLLSPHLNSQSSHSSVSISDVADLIEYSDRSYSLEQNQNKEIESEVSPSKQSNKSKNAASDQNIVPSEDSGDFSDSPIPSLSNLSLDVHSD